MKKNLKSKKKLVLFFCLAWKADDMLFFFCKKIIKRYVILKAYFLIIKELVKK
jgi:hypothetical protein